MRNMDQVITPSHLDIYPLVLSTRVDKKINKDQFLILDVYKTMALSIRNTIFSPKKMA